MVVARRDESMKGSRTPCAVVVTSVLKMTRRWDCVSPRNTWSSRIEWFA